MGGPIRFWSRPSQVTKRSTVVMDKACRITVTVQDHKPTDRKSVV